MPFLTIARAMRPRLPANSKPFAVSFDSVADDLELWQNGLQVP
jgi:hypothetical protein